MLTSISGKSGFLYTTPLLFENHISYVTVSLFSYSRLPSIASVLLVCHSLYKSRALRSPCDREMMSSWHWRLEGLSPYPPRTLDSYYTQAQVATPLPLSLSAALFGDGDVHFVLTNCLFLEWPTVPSYPTQARPDTVSFMC